MLDQTPPTTGGKSKLVLDEEQEQRPREHPAAVRPFSRPLLLRATTSQGRFPYVTEEEAGAQGGEVTAQGHPAGMCSIDNPLLVICMSSGMNNPPLQESVNSFLIGSGIQHWGQ